MSISSHHHDTEFEAEYGYHTLKRSYQEDIIDGMYQIHIDRPVPELGNQFCRYYFATHIETAKEYFAIIFDRSFNVSVKELSILKNSHCPNLNKVITYSLVRLSSGKKYLIGAIVEAYNPVETLQRHIETKGSMEYEEVSEEIIPAFINILTFCNEHKLNCGNINPANITFTKDKKVILREFCNSLPNFDQPPSFLAPEIADAIPAGRKVFGISADIYAFGMLIYYSLTGNIPDFSKHEPLLFNASRMEGGSYNLTAGRTHLSQKFKLLLAGTLADDTPHRWKIDNILTWSDSSGLIKQPKTKSSAGYTTLFKGQNYSNPAALISAMSIFYEDGVKFCYQDGFLKWAQKVQNKGDMLEELIHSSQDVRINEIVTEDQEERILKIISLLDHHSPIRMRDFCISVASIPNILFYAINRNYKIWLSNITKIFRRNYWKLLVSKESADELPKEYLEIIDNISSKLIADSSVQIMERIVYDLDHYVPCMSPLVVNDYVLSLSDILVALDKVAAGAPGKVNIDSHITSFIRSRLKKEDLDNKKSTAAVDSPVLKSLSLLALAQEHAPDIKIPHLCSVVAQKLIEWANDNLHNTKLRNVITSELAELAGGGMISPMLYVISNPKLFQNDDKGYNVACRQVKALSKDIKILSDHEEVYRVGLALGQRLTVLFGYILCMLVGLILAM